jgi:hypothetical protein
LIDWIIAFEGKVMNDVGYTLLFFLIVFSLGACFVTVFWELEQARVRWRDKGANKTRMITPAPLRRR